MLDHQLILLATPRQIGVLNWRPGHMHWLGEFSASAEGLAAFQQNRGQARTSAGAAGGRHGGRRLPDRCHAAREGTPTRRTAGAQDQAGVPQCALYRRMAAGTRNNRPSRRPLSAVCPDRCRLADALAERAASRTRAAVRDHPAGTGVPVSVEQTQGAGNPHPAGLPPQQQPAAVLLPSWPAAFFAPDRRRHADPVTRQCGRRNCQDAALSHRPAHPAARSPPACAAA